jgi:hypothetical protein
MKFREPLWYLAQYGTPKEKFQHAYWHLRTGKGWPEKVDSRTCEALGRLMKDWLATSAWKTNAEDEKLAQQLAHKIDTYTGDMQMEALGWAYRRSRDRFNPHTYNGMMTSR